MLESVVVILAIILDRNCLSQVAELDDYLRIVFINFDRRDVFDHSFDLFQYIGYQDGVIGRQVTSRFLNDCRMGDVFVFTDLFDGIDDIVGKFLGGVIRGGIKSRSRPVVIDRHPAADVEQFNRNFHLKDLGIDPGGFFHCVFDPLDVGQLRADGKVQQPQHVNPVGFFQTINYFQQFGGGEPELRRFTAGFLPASGTFGVKLDAHSDYRHVAFMPVGDAENVVQFAELLDDNNDALA